MARTQHHIVGMNENLAQAYHRTLVPESTINSVHYAPSHRAKQFSPPMARSVAEPLAWCVFVGQHHSFAASGLQTLAVSLNFPDFRFIGTFRLSNKPTSGFTDVCRCRWPVEALQRISPRVSRLILLIHISINCTCELLEKNQHSALHLRSFSLKRWYAFTVTMIITNSDSTLHYPVVITPTNTEY
jgi:hypothetical protein